MQLCTHQQKWTTTSSAKVKRNIPEQLETKMQGQGAGMFEVCANYEDQCGHVLSAPNVKLNRFSLNVSIYHKVTAAWHLIWRDWSCPLLLILSSPTPEYQNENVNVLAKKMRILWRKVLRTIITLIEEMKFQFNFVIRDFLFIKI